MTNSWARISAEVDAVRVRDYRRKLDSNGEWDETLESFVALIERIREEITGEYPRKYLAESEIWGDSTLSLQLSTDDYERRQKALSWALVEILPEAQSPKMVKGALRCIERHGANVDSEPEHEEAFLALLQVLESSPTKVRGDAWRFFADQAVVCVEAGVAPKEVVHHVLNIGYCGRTKKIVSSALEAFGGPLA